MPERILDTTPILAAKILTMLNDMGRNAACFAFSYFSLDGQGPLVKQVTRQQNRVL